VAFAAKDDDEVDGGSDAEGDGGAEDDETSQSDSKGDAEERTRQKRQKRVDKLLALLEEPTAAAAKAAKARKAPTTHTKEELAKAAMIAAQEEHDDDVRNNGSGKLDKDERIASDRKLLETRRKFSLEQYAQALREQSERWKIEDIVRGSDVGINAKRVTYLAALIENNRAYVKYSDYLIDSHESIHAQAHQECSTRAANGEDARDVRARWEAFERYGCCGAFEDTFFDLRNGYKPSP
jgi:hypothetical protein